MASVLYLKECASTNDEIESFLLYGQSEIQAICTFNQTKGKGQYGNSWESPENLNVAYSLAIPSEKIKVRGNLLNFHTAIILRDFFANLTKTEAAIKWPNDLIIKNKKVSGILIEKKTMNEKSYFIIGIGLNVLQENFENLPKAGSLLTQTGIQFNLEDLTNQLHEFILNHISEEITDENLLAKLNVNLFRKDLISVFESNRIRQNGIIKNVDEEGFLWVELENEGLKRFFHKEIELLY